MTQEGTATSAEELKALDAWLTVIGRDGWRAATLEAAANEAGLEPARIAPALADPIDALSAFLAAISRDSLAAAAAAAGSVRDRLFDGIMAGFDRLQAHRPSVEAIIAARDPAIPALVAMGALPAARRLAAAAGVGTVGPQGALRVAALSGLLARVLHAWRKDESADMAATMAELDRLLEEAERAATKGIRELLPAFPFPGRNDPAPAPEPDPPAQ